MLNYIKARLGLKVALAITTIAVAVFSLLGFLTITWLRGSMVEQLEKTMAEEAKLIYRDIEKPMVVGDDTGTRDEFAYLAYHFEDTDVLMTNFKNNVTYGTTLDSERKQLPELVDNAQVQELAASTLATGQGGNLLTMVNGSMKFVSTTAIPNEKSCNHCHGASQPILGQLVVIKDVSSTFAAIDAKAWTIAGLCAAGLALLVTACVVLMRRAVVKPLAAIGLGAEGVAQGDYNANLAVDSSDELGQLSHNLQTMVHTLKEQLGFSQGILDGMSVPCVVVDTEERLTFATPAVLELIGHGGEPKDYYGQKLAEFFPGDPGRKTSAGTVMQTREQILGRPADFVNHKGKQCHAQVSVSPLTDLDGALIGAFSIYLDLTELTVQQQTIEDQSVKLADAARQADAIAERVSSSSEELSAQIEQSSRGADEQRAMSTESATAMEEMNATVLEVARSAAQAAEMADQARARAADGEAVVKEALGLISSVAVKANTLKTDMGSLGEQADGIGQIMNVISDIADQTNLLALNAAIEAARAGDAGRGFAVVADEVRKLAEKTMAATGDVGQYIGAIQDSARRNIAQTEEAVDAIHASTAKAEGSGEVLREIVSMVEATSDQVRSIATASEEQSAASEEISRATESVSRIAEETADAMNQSAEATRDLAQMAHDMKTIIQHMQS